MELHFRDVSKTYSNGMQVLKDVTLTIPVVEAELLRAVDDLHGRICGKIARISPTGVIAATSKVVRHSEPFGFTVAPNGNPWFTMLSADKIATLQLS